MTSLMLPSSVHDMAHSTSLSAPNNSAGIELPRYRGHRSNSTNDAKQVNDIGVERYHSFDSGYPHSVTDSTTLHTADTQASTCSLLTKPTIRKLVFRRHWFHTDMTVYSVDLSGTPSGSLTLEFSNTIPSSPPQTTDSETETPVYHLATTEFSFSAPDIIMYSGSIPDPAHILGVSHFRWSRNARMAFGSEATDDKSPNLTWEELKNTSSYLLHSTYEFSVPTSSSPSTSSPRRHFRLQRTHAPEDGVVGIAGRWSYRNYRLIDLDSHETIGVFLADNLRSLTKKGELRLFRSLAKEVEVGVVLALGSVSEKHTRRERHCKYGGKGG